MTELREPWESRVASPRSITSTAVSARVRCQLRPGPGKASSTGAMRWRGKSSARSTPLSGAEPAGQSSTSSKTRNSEVSSWTARTSSAWVGVRSPGAEAACAMVCATDSHAALARISRWSSSSERIRSVASMGSTVARDSGAKAVAKSGRPCGEEGVKRSPDSREQGVAAPRERCSDITLEAGPGRTG